ncbi:hypothetical protein ACQKNB_24095, partial [Lysinibacillus xylanilyticus]|uniref:hypothetical protein n=1 Tax=Lysinibacillus xylanilyticus TaxID=582475 RepID=UPI003D06EC0A
LSVALTLLSVTSMAFRRFGSSFRHSDDSIRRSDSSFRHSDDSIRRFDSSILHFHGSILRSDSSIISLPLLSSILNTHKKTKTIFN